MVGQSSVIIILPLFLLQGLGKIQQGLPCSESFSDDSIRIFLAFLIIQGRAITPNVTTLIASFAAVCRGYVNDSHTGHQLQLEEFM